MVRIRASVNFRKKKPKNTLTLKATATENILQYQENLSYMFKIEVQTPISNPYK